MPNLGEMFQLCNRKTNYRWSAQTVWEALNEAGFFVYAAVLKENRGFFIVIDESSITLAPGTQEYQVPASCTQVLHLAERISASEDWHTIRNSSLAQVLTQQQNTFLSMWSADGLYGDDSQFTFYGPYLDKADTDIQPDIDNTLQVQKIRLQPQIDQTRSCQIVYTAKWLPIIDQTSALMLPEEGTHAMVNFALANLCQDGDDSRAEGYSERAQNHLAMFLTWTRDRQLQDGPKVSAYLD